MRTLPRFVLLALLGLLMACGDRTGAPSVDLGIALPGPGPSWIAGTREQPTGGRIVVGLLLPQREPQRLADLIPADKLRAFLEGKTLDREDRVVEWESFRASHRTWGPEAAHLANVAQDLRAKHHVEVVFREVLPDECADLPLVVVGARGLSRHERRILAAYREQGGRLIRLDRSVVPAARRANHATIVGEALRGVLADSTLLRVLPVDPLAAEAVREGDDVVLTLPHPGTSVVLEAPDGRALATAVADANGQVRMQAPDPALDPFMHHVVVRWEGEGLALERAHSLFELVGTVERTYEAPDQVHAGGVMALRVRTSNKGAAVADSKGLIELVREERVLASAPYTTDAHGYAHPRLTLPADAEPGKALLRCDGLTRAIQVTSGVRLSVVTDRPLYKQTDAVHVRLMAHRAGDGRPVANQEVELSLGDAKRMVTTSAHGIASHTFQLTGAKVGGRAVEAKAGGATARCGFRVKAFERPTFTVRAEPAELTLRPGEAAPVTFTAAYVNGSPLVGGNLSFAPHRVRLQETPNRFDAFGRARAIVRAPTKGGGGVRLSVQDVDGRIVDVTVPVRIEREGPRLGIHALSDLVVGVPARFLVTSSEPGTIRLGGAFDGPRTVDVGEDGEAILTLTPERTGLTLRLIPASGTAHERTFKAARATELSPVLALDRRTARVGETLRLALRSRESGLVHIDVWKDQTVVRTLEAQLEDGAADLELALDASLAGVLQIHARLASGKANARRATVLVTRGRALQVEATPAAESYAPGTTATVDVHVRDAAGKPTPAVLGYWGVDEALLALAPATEGHERVFDVVTALAPEDERLLAGRTDRGEEVLLAEILTRFHDREKHAAKLKRMPVVLERTPQLVAAAASARTQHFEDGVARIWKAYEGAWKELPVTELERSDSVRETLRWLARRGRLEAALLVDPWGTPLRLWSDRRSVWIRWSSAGPDRAFGTHDDLGTGWSGHQLYDALPQRIRDFHVWVQAYYEEPLEEDTEEAGGEPILKDEELFDAWETDGDMPLEEAAPAGAFFEGPANNGSIGIGGAAGRAFRGRGGRRDLGTGGGGRKAFAEAPVHLRTDFDPTLCFVPEAIVGPDGKTRLEIPLKDSMTTWRLRLVASRADGAVGVGTGRIRVKQPVHATPWLSPHLTVGDVVDVPVAIRNEEAFAIQAQVTFAASEHLRLATPAAITVPVEAGATGRAIFRVEAVKAGRSAVRLAVDTGGAQDRQERVLTVHPDARAVVAVASGNVSADMAFPTRLETPGPGDVRVDLYPSPLTEILSGFEGLIRAPHG